MNSKMWKVMLLLAMAVNVIVADELTVSKATGIGVYRTITEAIKNAKDGDEVVIMDAEVYEEQVDIRNLKNFTLRSENPNSLKKPTIKFRDTKNNQPKDKDEALDTSKMTFDQNGALRILRSFNVTIDGIAVSGDEGYYYGYDGVWYNKNDNKYWPLQHGNIALCIYVSGKVTVRNCDIKDAYIGISVKDRNEGGIFANSNPADLQTWKVVPLSGFGKTGDHLIEYNRIHNNSFGMYFESVWDLGSIIRYNLFYENHHPKGQLTKIQGITGEGTNLCGGAIAFKDHILSPLAIHNNTFYKNTISFIGLWRTGEHYLVCNNIVADPYVTELPGATWMFLDPWFHNRMFNCIYAAHVQLPIQQQKIEAQSYDTILKEMAKVIKYSYQPQIMNEFGNVEETDWIIPVPLSDGTVFNFTAQRVKIPGNRIISTGKAGYSAANNIRWLEMGKLFKSTDPTDAEFLEPDWDDSLVNLYVLDKGYAVLGIRDPDGSPADLGAICKEGGQFENQLRIKPASAIQISDDFNATISFFVSGGANPVTDMKIKYARWIDSLPNNAGTPPGNSMGQDKVILPKSEIIEITGLPSVKMDLNVMKFKVPTRSKSNEYAFLEFVIEGIDSKTGDTVLSTVGFLPYRKIDYRFDVKILDPEDKDKELDSVVAGQPVILYIEPKSTSGKPWDSQTPIDQTDIALMSTYELLDKDDKPVSIPSFKGSYEVEVKFTKVPEGGASDMVQVNGLFTVDQSSLAISGNSKDIKVKPGDPDHLKFSNPPSKKYGIIDPGRNFDVKVIVYDKYENQIDQKTDVTLKSLDPGKGDVVGEGSTKTDSTGTAYFKVEVTGGAEKDTFKLEAKLVVKDNTDDANLIVGKARDKLYIFFEGDSGATQIDESLKLQACAGEMVPIVIKRIGKIDGVFKVMSADSDSVSFEIDPSQNLGVYASNDPLGNKITSAKTTKGQVTLWIKATNLMVVNGKINVYPIDNPAVLSNERSGINFGQCTPKIETAAYFADSGNGQVNRLEVYYKEALEETEVPDTFKLYWPHNQGDPKLVSRTDLGSVIVDQNNKKHITVLLKDPFNPVPMVTNSFTSNLGITVWKNPLLEEATFQTEKFSIADSIGPILTSAVLVENLSTSSDDTLFINISERVQENDIIGKTLRLIKRKGGNKVDLEIKDAKYGVGDSIKIIVKDIKDVSIEEGDSLCIISSSAIQDKDKNHALPNNKPVYIRLKSVSPSIKYAFYKDIKDNSADGNVDYVCIVFNKKVKKENIDAEFSWDDNSGKCTTSVINWQYVKGDSTRVEASVSFSNKDIKTSGAMTAEVTFADYGNAKTEWSVDDSAAPVIKSATLIPCEVLKSDGSYDKDTLEVEFSEKIESTELSQSKQFFQFYNQNNKKYSMTVSRQREAGNKIRFIVNSLDPSEEITVENFYPKTGDLIQMRIGSDGYFADDNGNWQLKENNLKAPLNVKAVDADAEVKVGPNPFNSKLNEVTKFYVGPKAKNSAGIKVVATVTIYDRLGNKIFQKKGEDIEKGRVEIAWDGYTKSGKLAGIGTYVAKVKWKLEPYGDASRISESNGEEILKIGHTNKVK